ncbi:MAG: hypothetical protein K5770_00870 [Lachnospiraceae bacterium]|nr:hypothetical protein [Lachnospiraceae bacterium]
MKKSIILKLCILAAAFTLFPAVSIRADQAENARIEKELEGSGITLERNYRLARYSACVEETRIAKQYLGSLETLAKANPLYEGMIEAAKARVTQAEEAEEKAREALQTAMDISIAARDSQVISVNEKQIFKVIDKDGIMRGSFSAQTTGVPKDPGAALIISDLPSAYTDYEGYGIVARYYDMENLTETTEKSTTAGRTTGTITVTGEIPDGGYADQVAVEIFVGEGHTVLFLWNEDGELKVTDRD